MIKRILAAAALVLALATPSLAQNYVPAGGGSGATTCAGITDAGTVCPKNVGTSGATVPLNSTANTFALGQTMASDVINGTGGAGYVEFGPQSAQPSTPAANTFRIFANSTGKFTWIGANGFLRVFDGTANTADRTYTLPDVTGTMTVLGNASTGSGSVVLQGTPTLTTPVLGVATGTSLALGGATIGTDALGVTGTSSFSSAITVAGTINATGSGLIRVLNDTGSFRLGSAGDTILSRPAAATIQHGAADAASPVAQTEQAQSVAVGTNAAGVNWTFIGSKSTGPNAGGSLIFQTSPADTTHATTAASGTGTTATITFSGTNVYTVGGTITVAGVTPAGYNGVGQTVTASSAGSVSFTNATTGAQTVAGTVVGVTTVNAPTENARITSQGLRMPIGNYLSTNTSTTNIAGFHSSGDSLIFLIANGTDILRFDANAAGGANYASIGWTTGGAPDAFLVRGGAAATLMIGYGNMAVPINQTLTVSGSRSGTDTNVAGANFTIQSGNGTGNAAVSGVTIQAPTAVASGTGAQTQTNVAVFKTTGVTITPGIIAGGSAPTLSGTCTTGSQVGGNTAGSFTATCTAQTVIITFATTAPNGWVCDASDETTSADSLKQTSHTTTSCTLTGTTVAADVVVFHASAF